MTPGKCIMREEPKPRQFIFDGPFMMTLKQSDKVTGGDSTFLPPYFVAWIGNTDILKKKEGTGLTRKWS